MAEPPRPPPPLPDPRSAAERNAEALGVHGFRTGAANSLRDVGDQAPERSSPPTSVFKEIKKRFSWTALLVFIVSEGMGATLSIAGGEAAAHEQTRPALVGWGFGLPLMALGFGFPFMSEATRDRVGRVVTYCAPVAVLLAYLYVVGMPTISGRSGGSSRQLIVTQEIAAAVGPVIRAEMERALTGPEQRLQQTQSSVTGKIDELAKGLAAVQRRLGHTLSAGVLDDDDYEGRPLGFAWNSVYIEVSWINANDRLLGASNFYLVGKNFGLKEIQLQAAYLISAIDGSKLPVRVRVPPGVWINPSETGPVPPTAQFTLSAEFAPSTSGMPEADFMKTWSRFFVVVDADGQEVRHEIPESVIRWVFDANHPERAPHVERRKP